MSIVIYTLVGQDGIDARRRLFLCVVWFSLLFLQLLLVVGWVLFVGGGLGFFCFSFFLFCVLLVLLVLLFLFFSKATAVFLNK